MHALPDLPPLSRFRTRRVRMPEERPRLHARARAAQAARVVDEVGEVLGFAVARAVDADDEGGEAQDAGDVVPDPVALAPRVGVRADEVGVVGEGFEVRRSRILEPAELGFVHVDAHLRLLPRHLRELLALELRQGAALGEVPLVQGLAALVAARVRTRGPGLARGRGGRGGDRRAARARRALLARIRGRRRGRDARRGALDERRRAGRGGAPARLSAVAHRARARPEEPGPGAEEVCRAYGPRRGVKEGGEADASG